jgi:hypothetical protein
VSAAGINEHDEWDRKPCHAAFHAFRGAAVKEIRQFCQIRLPSPASLGWNAAALTSRIDSAAFSTQTS